MAPSQVHESEEERDLREKILAGSQQVDDYNALGQLLWHSDRGREAVAVLEGALSLPMTDLQRAAVSAELAWMLYGFRQDERAVAMAQAALSHVPNELDTPEILRIRGLIYTTLGHCTYSKARAASDQAVTMALEAFERLISRYPDFGDPVEAILHAAELCVLREDFTAAIAYYEQAMRSDPSQPNKLDCELGIGNALRCLGRYTEAEDHLREALRLAEADIQVLPRIHFEWGKVHRITDRLQEAIAAFEQALIALEPNSDLARDRQFLNEIKWELGHLYYDVGRYGDAVAALQEALPDLPRPTPYFDTLLSLGQCYVVSQQYARARDCYEEVLASAEPTEEQLAAAQEGLAALPCPPKKRFH